ncbi:MAG: hypothetical protein RJA00_669 [Bacteroidota bacterium]|jgi:hypothetical protein
MQIRNFMAPGWIAGLVLGIFCATTTSLQAQTETPQTPQDTLTPAEEEDYSQYDNIGFAAEGAKRYCSPKIEGLSPAKLISIGYDYQMGYTMKADTFRRLGSVAPLMPDSARVLTSNGMRFGCNIPVISRTDLVWQMGANYWEQRYKFEDPSALKNPMLTSLSENGLRTMGINTTLFKPLNDVKFLLFQGSADLSGDYQFGKFMPLKYTKYSAALIYGKRTSEKKQWGVGVARTYRVGELNYIPIIFYNSTDVANKWGTEILFPARAHVRRTINSRNMLFAGYELEGQSYRLWRSNDQTGFNLRNEDVEIRRGEIRLRAVYEFSLKDFIWMSIQAGYRINYRYDVDRLGNGKEIYRAFGLASDAPYVMVNQLTNPLYFNISLNLVSP